MISAQAEVVATLLSADVDVLLEPVTDPWIVGHGFPERMCGPAYDGVA
jgi:hypothetical protein